MLLEPFFIFHKLAHFSLFQPTVQTTWFVQGDHGHSFIYPNVPSYDLFTLPGIAKCLSSCISSTDRPWHPSSIFVSGTYRSRDFGIVLENLSLSRFFLFFLSKCFRGQACVRKSVFIQIFLFFLSKCYHGQTKLKK